MSHEPNSPITNTHEKIEEKQDAVHKGIIITLFILTCTLVFWIKHAKENRNNAAIIKIVEEKTKVMRIHPKLLSDSISTDLNK